MPNDELTPEEKLLRVIQKGDDREDDPASPTPESDRADETPASPSSSSVSSADADVPVRDETPGGGDDAGDPTAEAPAKERRRLRLTDRPEAKTSPAPGGAAPGGDNTESASASSDDMLLADEADDVVADDGVGDDEDVVADDAADAEAVATTPLAKKRVAEPDGVRRVNRLLLAAVLLILALIGFEIWANVSVKTLPAAMEGDMRLPEPVDTELPPYEMIAEEFEEPEWFHVAKNQTNRPPDEVDKKTATQRFLEENVKLAGLSELPDGTAEAIIVDVVPEPDKMHFLEENDRMAAGERDSPRLFTLVRIGRDHVVLSDGTEEYIVK